MKRLFLFSAVLLLGMGLVSAQTSKAQVSIGPRLGVPVGDLSDAASLYIGADARFNTPSLPVVPNASFDYYLTDVDGQSIITVDLNALYPFEGTGMSFLPYGGAGLGITRSSFEFTNPATGQTTTNTDSEVGFNLIGGLQFQTGSLKPFAQANVTVGGDNTRFGLTGGLLFGF